MMKINKNNKRKKKKRKNNIFVYVENNLKRPLRYLCIKKWHLKIQGALNRLEK